MASGFGQLRRCLVVSASIGGQQKGRLFRASLLCQFGRILVRPRGDDSKLLGTTSPFVGVLASVYNLVSGIHLG